MADNKKSFVLYCDIIKTVEKLPNETAGELFKHLLSYVNDEEPETDNLLVEVAFEPIKQQLKRDLVKWDEIREKRSEAGKKSAQAKKNKLQQNQQVLTSVKSVEQTSTKSTVNDTVNVTVNDNVINNISPLDEVRHNQTNEEFLRFCKYIDSLEEVKKIKKQINFEQYQSIKQKYPKDLVGDKLEALNNWLLDPNVPKGKKNKKSLYHLMVNTWLKNGY